MTHLRLIVCIDRSDHHVSVWTDEYLNDHNPNLEGDLILKDDFDLECEGEIVFVSWTSIDDIQVDKEASNDPSRNCECVSINGDSENFFFFVDWLLNKEKKRLMERISDIDYKLDTMKRLKTNGIVYDMGDLILDMESL
jgi:hypothetical protein